MSLLASKGFKAGVVARQCTFMYFGGLALEGGSGILNVACFYFFVQSYPAYFKLLNYCQTLALEMNDTKTLL